jgi:hypothetical protein
MVIEAIKTHNIMKAENDGADCRVGRVFESHQRDCRGVHTPHSDCAVPAVPGRVAAAGPLRLIEEGWQLESS